MKADKTYIEEAVGRFNLLCFDGALPPIPVVLTRARSFLGKVTYRRTRGLFGSLSKCDDFTLRISSLYDLPEREWEDVVLHEMIHYYIAVSGIRDTSAHGPAFRGMMERINRQYGRNVTVRHHVADGQLPPKAVPPCGNCVCISHLQDGKWGVTVCSEAMMPSLQRKLPRCFHLKSATWLRSSDPFFDKFPRSRTPKIYKITADEALIRLRVRQSTPQDLPALMRIYAESRSIQIESGNLHQWKDGYPSEAIVSGDISRGVNYVIEDGGTIVGTFTLILGKDPTYSVIEDGAWLDDEKPYATIHRLGSLKSVHGVAKVCFDWCWNQHHNLRVDTHEDNAIMRHCIEKAGFTYCGIIHVLNGDPRLAFQKCLP